MPPDPTAARFSPLEAFSTKSVLRADSSPTPFKNHVGTCIVMNRSVHYKNNLLFCYKHVVCRPQSLAVRIFTQIIKHINSQQQSRKAVQVNCAETSFNSKINLYSGLVCYTCKIRQARFIAFDEISVSVCWISIVPIVFIVLIGQAFSHIGNIRHLSPQ